MTDKEKARAYDEALERAKDIKNGPCPCDESIATADYIFPELRESEDERLRQTLYDEIKNWDASYRMFKTYPKESILAYLEKQKEEKPADKQDYSGLTDLERAIHRGFLAAGVENVPVTIIKETAQECLAQMKPAEWSEEDEKMLSDVIKLLKVKNEKFIPCDAEVSWLNELPNRFNLQPKPEWSEEDENNIDCVIDLLYILDSYIGDDCSMSQEKSYEIRNKIQKEICPWLKSLRPSWKPSEEQMEALKNSAYGIYQNGDGPALRDLYEQIKKLI